MILAMLPAIIALAMFVVGVIAVASAKSDIQIIVAVLAFGFGKLLLAQVEIIKSLRRLRKAPSKLNF